MEELEEYIYNNNIYVFRKSFECKELKALYKEFDGKHCIGIDYSKINSATEEYCILAHEIGHYETGAIYTCMSTSSDVSRAEYRADKHMVNEIIPLAKLKDFIRKDKPRYNCEIAEEFGVTEETVKKALNIYCLI